MCKWDVHTCPGMSAFKFIRADRKQPNHKSNPLNTYISYIIYIDHTRNQNICGKTFWFLFPCCVSKTKECCRTSGFEFVCNDVCVCVLGLFSYELCRVYGGSDGANE